MDKRKVAFLSILLLSALLAPFSIKTAYSSRNMPPIVSTAWLYAHLGLVDIVVLDIRSPEEYNANHIPGAINVPSYMWFTNPPFGAEFPWMEMPSDDYLFELLGNNSITEDSWVVVVGSTSGPLAPLPLALYNIATVTRVALTLLYAGVENVAILDGGFEKWVADGYPTQSGTITPTPVTYTGTVKSEMLVDKQYVADKIGEAIIIDARDLEVYLGFILEPWCARVGHIPTARSFPTPWLWDLTINATDGTVIYGTYKNVNVLKTFAECIVGANKSMEVIVYCGVGGYASTMYFVLSEVLNYTNVKFYDGSAQEWTSDLTLPVVYEDLGSEYMDLQSSYDQLQEDFNQLQNDFNQLQDDFNELQAMYDELQYNYSQLQNSFIQLQNNITQIQNSLTQLQNSFAQLQNNYNQLQNSFIQLRNNVTQIQSSLAQLQKDFEALYELAKTSTPAYLTYIFVATTVILLISTVYLATKVRKKG